jgi:chorismate synthase
MFRVTTFGESHGVALGCVVDGCPAGLRLDAADIQADLDRRKPGQSALTTTRGESDTVEILSGVYEGTTLGTPIAMMVRNADARSRAYEKMREVYRPGHADFTWDAKFGVRDWRGGGRASARETVGRVAAGAVARKLLQALFGAEVLAWVDAVDQVSASVDPEAVRREQIEATPVRCPDLAAAARMIEVIEQARLSGDTVGGVVRCVARNVPAGLGEPVFDKLDGELGRALLSIPAAKGVEIGSGFASTHMRGTEHNDPFALDAEGGVITTSNRAGGMLGGISNGMPILAAVAFKPVATHFHPQQSVTSAPHELAELRATGRHDPCVLPRAAPIVEAMVCLVLADLALRQRGARLSP